MGLFLVFMFGFAVVTAIAAAARGRNALAWFFIGALTGVFGLIAVLVMEPGQGASANSGARPLRYPPDDKNY